jgi:hypothetical protein
MVDGSLRVLLLLPKTGCHDIAEILLKVALSTKNQIDQILFVIHWIFVDGKI